jgi:hypothetical protein
MFLYCLAIWWGHTLAQLVEALRYNLEGRGFDSRGCHWPWGRLSLWRKWVPETFPWGKDDRCVGLRTLLTSCADCLEMLDPQPPGTLRACPNPYRDCLAFLTIWCHMHSKVTDYWPFHVHVAAVTHVSHTVLFTVDRNIWFSVMFVVPLMISAFTALFPLCYLQPKLQGSLHRRHTDFRMASSHFISIWWSVINHLKTKGVCVV